MERQGKFSFTQRAREFIKTKIVGPQEDPEFKTVFIDPIAKYHSESNHDYEARLRKEYKYAVIEPYLSQLPISVIEVMLDIDIYSLADRHGIVKDKSGNPVTLYDFRRKSGEVENTIRRFKRINRIKQDSQVEVHPESS